ncbi:hypothetical protein [Demequina aestuarii]|uniref:hypothetical protein n=1 Tax=Demequina aestuarii TaxID=327095 RepID=UPI000B058111|nr:hypothetical protein [Demequina aestuarii]
MRWQSRSPFGQFTMVVIGPDAPALAVQIMVDTLEEPDVDPDCRQLDCGIPCG